MYILSFSHAWSRCFHFFEYTTVKLGQNGKFSGNLTVKHVCDKIK